MKENMREELQAGVQEKKYLFTNDFVFYSVLTANEKICKDLVELLLEDETETVFLNASGDRSGVSRELSEFLDYIKTAEPKGELAGEIEEEIEQVTQSPEWRKTYMTFEMKLKDIREEFYEKGREEGREEGIEEGREEGIEKGREEGIEIGHKGGVYEGVINTGKAMQLDDDRIIENLIKVCGVTEAEAAGILRDFYQKQK